MLVGGALFIVLVSCTERDAQPAATARGAEPSEPPPRSPAPEPAPVDAGPVEPPKRLFTKHWASHVYAEPDRHSRQLGYLRAGSILNATTSDPVPGKGCRRGWYELETGGYVCDGIHVHAFDGPRLPDRQPTQPDLDAALPYRYARVRRDHAPMYRRLPSAREARAVRQLLEAAKRRARRDASELELGEETMSALSPDDPETRVTLPTTLAGRADAGAVAAVTLDALRGGRDDLVRQWLLKGFYYSLDEEREAEGARYWRTQRNGFVAARDFHLVEGSAFQGVALEIGASANSQLADGGAGDAGRLRRPWRLPIGFVLSGRFPKYRRTDEGWLRRVGFPGYHHAFRIVATRRFRGRRYLQSAEGWWIRERHVGLVERAERPAELAAEAKWLDVDLAAQTLVAYEGDTPVYATLISSGRVARSGDPRRNYATPDGLFRISSKHLTHIMDGDHAIDGPYTIEDVPYVMYFHMAYALHGAFWHNRFGRPKSHGCINMAPADARWVFRWAEPALPEGWHALFIPEEEPTTWVRIRGETPEG